MDGEMLGALVIVRDHGTRLHRAGGNPIDHKPVAHDVMCLGNGLVDRCRIAAFGEYALVVYAVFPYPRTIGCVGIRG